MTWHFASGSSFLFLATDRVSADHRFQALEFNELVGLAPKVVGNRRRTRGQRRYYANAFAATLQSRNKGPEFSVACKNNDMVGLVR